MRRRVLSSSLIVGVVAVGLGRAPAVPFAHRAMHLVPPSMHLLTDLDSFSDAQLERDLRDELDDALEGHSPNDVASVATLQAAIMEALSDDGDEGDEAEISFADLEEEMHENGTDVASVVHDVLEQLNTASRARGTVHLAVWRGAGEPGMQPSYGLAVRNVNKGLIKQIRAHK